MNRRSDSLLKLLDLTVEYSSGKYSHIALKGVNCEIHRSEIVGLLGESGSGKTTLALALLRLLPPSARILTGSIHLNGKDMLTLTESHLEAIRGAEISMIFQEPGLVLNPVMRAIDQVVEVVRAHHKKSSRQCKEEARRLLGEVGLANEERLLEAYPHELSGGQQQRLVVAQALAAKPALLVADEPTTSVDPILRAQLRTLLNDLRQRFGLALLFITHDPDDLIDIADRVLVLHRGQIVEEASLPQLIREPAHPYTKLLLQAMPPRPGAARKGSKYLPAMADNPGAPF